MPRKPTMQDGADTSSLIAELRELMDAATKRPWKAIKNTGIIASDEDRCHVGRIGDFRDAELLPFNKKRWTADTNLIAKAVNALPILLTSLERAEERVKELEADIERKQKLLDAAERIMAGDLRRAAEPLPSPPGRSKP